MLILASQSPRRRELLSRLPYLFSCRAADLDETALLEQISQKEGRRLHPEEEVLLLAKAKAETVQAELSADERAQALILGSDTLVAVNEKVYGKPTNTAEAANFLRELSGREHSVYTAVTLLSPDGQHQSFVSRSRVRFYPYDACFERQMQRYIASGAPLDKAGAYGIQDPGACFIEGINGDYFTIVGLPLARLARLLDQVERDPAWGGLLTLRPEND